MDFYVAIPVLFCKVSDLRLIRHADATEQLLKALSLQALEGTDVPVNQTTHTLKLLGKTVNGGRVVASIRMAFSAKSGVTMKIVARSEEEDVAALVVASVA